MKHRTALVAALSVAGVLAAGATAIAANLGILDSTDSGFGQLSAVAATSTTDAGQAPEVVTVYVDDTSAITVPETTSPTAPTTTIVPATGPELLPYAIEGAGIVTLAREGNTITVAAVDAPGWAWSLEDDGDEVDLVLRSGTRTLQFKAEIQDGAVKVDVGEAATGPTTTRPDGDDDGDDDGEDDDGEDDDGEDDDGEDHEGWEDDD